MKSEEFGAKCNKLLVDGLSFIEKQSFNPFNEGTRLQHCVKLHRRLFGVDVRKIGGDLGYAGTENRDWCKANGIQTSFVKRGRPYGGGDQEVQGLCEERDGEGEDHRDGGLVRDTEGALLAEACEGQEEGD